jgi:hypothetical protein
MSVKTFRSKLLHDSHGYVGTLIGTEEPLFDLHIPGGDEIPDDCIEVAYLPSVFPRRGTSGCALGFRSGNSLIEWIVFSRPIDSDLSSWTTSHMRPNEISVKLDVHRDHPGKLFNLVAFVPKGLEQRRVKGSNPEHKKWHDSLWGAKVRPVAVKLRWKNFGNELKAHHEEMRARIGWENEETDDKQDEDEDDDDDSNYDDNSEEAIFDGKALDLSMNF